MKPRSKLFYKGHPIVYIPGTPITEYKEGTFCFNPESIYPWTRLILVRKKPVWAKIALRNVPKRYRLMLVLFE